MKTDMKFDCIVMNPPYSRNLHLKILAEAIKHLKDEKSVVVNLSPVRWLQDPLAKYKKSCDLKRFEESVAKHIESLDVIFPADATELFSAGLNSDVGVYKCVAGKTGFNYSNIASSSGKDFEFIGKIYEKVLAKASTFIRDVWVDYSKKTTGNYVLIQMIGGHVHRGTEQVVLNFVRNNYGWFVNDLSNRKTLEQLRAENPHVTNGNIDNWPAVCFGTGDEAKNFFNFANTKMMLFLSWGFSSNQSIAAAYMPFLGDATNPRTGLKGYQGEWTDDDLYQFFNITPEEQKTIEDTMKKYETA